ncbi:hypothetical protein BAUCODRAFT_272868 [Baudoinia panamericana UAMH 10762]|uniref:Uncharacterized protein n=1 Tax=Baudoinia panamericana (strain UAMH 10762) TaxID=717646 RepID=M2N261_BAUPA|nr:uncharacterized protein BAUCODRAFT_272868 [Baudoinia panamericana UAMH 10762]EMC93069.1 hypothetical protein BAUCODRAFT_272868 [Baudoinia panamericana UAMH 10762]
MSLRREHASIEHMLLQQHFGDLTEAQHCGTLRALTHRVPPSFVTPSPHVLRVDVVAMPCFHLANAATLRRSYGPFTMQELPTLSGEAT